ncbi:MAG: hypothetical protein RIQ81_45 [Pseudomonadota bacterium]
MSDRLTIRFLSGPLSGQMFSIGLGDLFFVGSDPACNAVIAGDPSVHAKHVCIYYRAPGKVLIKDLGSANGSRINGKQLGKTSKLRDGDRITVGTSATFQFTVWDPMQPTRMTGMLRRRLSSMSRLARRRVAPNPGAIPVFGDLGDVSWRPGNRVKTAVVGVMAGSALALMLFAGVRLYERNARNLPAGLPGVELRALTPGGSRENPSTRSSVSLPKLEVDRDFIWDEIVNISVRFGETPPSVMDVDFINKVQYWINRFTVRGYHRELLRRRQQYIPAIESALKEQNLPLELGYLVWIESAYEIDALSSAGAKGLWQLMPATAREYGLRVDQGRRIDERVDPLKSSRAAASYLNLLLKMFGGQRYLLAIASYNTGQNRVQRFQIATTIRQSRAADFWHLVDQLPAETVDYVPKFLAAVIVARNPGRF